MTFESALKQGVQKSSNIRFDLNNNLWPKLNAMQECLAILFDVPASYTKNLVQAVYYKNGGYPSENSPPKHTVLVEKVSQMYIMLKMINQDDLIKEEFLKFGLKIDDSELRLPISQNYRMADDKFVKNLEKSEIDFNFAKPLSNKELVEYFLEAMCEIQGEICKKADEIKIHQYDKINKRFPKKLKKKNFVAVVNTLATKLKNEELGVSKKEDAKHFNNMENYAFDITI